jgi:DNA-directed RNA polymerase beta' subunit
LLAYYAANTFDGDEMNLHMPQNVLAETELRHLAAIPYQIISPASNAPIIGIYQDSLLGSYRFTRPNIKLTPRHAMNLLMMYSKVDVKALREAGNKLTSYDVLSQIMAPITLVYKTKFFGDNEDFNTSIANVLEIRNGKYIRGQIEKGVLGGTTKGVLHRIFNDYGPMACSNFIDDLQNVITEYMKTSSYSVGVSDLIADKATNQKILQAITKQKLEVQSLIDKVHLGIFENNTVNTNSVEFEIQVNKILNKAMDESGKVARDSLNKDNRFLMIVNSGSKGNMLNISQMISGLGQQNVDGKRIPYGLDSRTLPHYSKYDDSPSARGFVENSYISGLTAQELFFHAMGGRIGLIDTAVKSVTWETPIIIIEHNRPKYTAIGKWIDAQLDDDANTEDIQHFTERQMELLNINDGDVFIPTTDENGIVTWGAVTAITRHDPGTELYEIKTSGGRRVIVTESKSLLIWNKETKKLVETLTPEIKVGDCVPVTEILCAPPITINHVDLTDYLPKSEYVYGTDFNIAMKAMMESMLTRNKIKSGWWSENNGSTFTLPYTKKSSLQRVYVRSNITNIRDGFIYPYNGNRKETMISDKFELNEENGIFLGLFLAEGNVHNSKIYIANNNENIRNFTKSWFDKRSISWSENSRINKIGGLSTSVIGSSCVLSEFLTRFVGKGAANKYVPSEAFVAPEEFIVGLLNGYFSGDGTVGKSSIDVGSASERLIEGISMLCSRIGVFGKVFKTQLKSNNLGTENILPSYRFSIRAKWGKIFSEKVTFIEESKAAKIKLITWGDVHRNFDTYNDIVLDAITEINIIGVEAHPKVYDLTIPSTLNFGLANGLQVRDTSQTGYIQRRLIKGLEDIKVEYDMTVRNNKGRIVQFAYGDDGIDATRVENQTVPIVGMSVEDIYMHYDIGDGISELFTKPAANRMKKEKVETQGYCQKYIDMMIEHRKIVIESVFRNKDENMVKLPVSFANCVSNIQGQLSLGANSIVDITPLDAFKMIESYFAKLQSIEMVKPGKLFEIMFYYYLSPKSLLVLKRFNKNALILLLETVVLRYKQAIVHPGEMVGVIAGQSIGEPTTQMTLNSVTYETLILVRDQNKNVEKISIGDFTVREKERSPKIDYTEKNDTTYAELRDFYEIPSCTQAGEIVWRRIEAVTKHPVVNLDGTNTMLKVTTCEEREVIVTKAKSLLKLVDNKVIPVSGDSLRVGDYVPVSLMPIEFNEHKHLDLRDILSPTEYIYSSELAKATSVMNEYHWWKNHANKTFTLPYKRSDSAFVALNTANSIYITGMVYTKRNSICNYTIPENIELDYDFGYLVGAYAAEGCMTKHQISISNNEHGYFAPIQRLCEKYNLTTKIYTHQDKNQKGWTSTDIRIYSTLLSNILEHLCGKLSHNKFVSDKIIFSNKECLLGFLDAYISGDGSVCKKSKIITMSSVSKQLLMDVQQMLNSLGVYSHIFKSKKQESNNRGILPENIRQPYILNVCGEQNKILAPMLNLTIGYKQDNLAGIMSHDYTFDIHKNATIIPNEIDGAIVYEERTPDKYSTLLFDKIKYIEEVPNTTDHAYDLTVEDTRTFVIYNGVACEDTFHLSGVASKSNVTRGVPRIEELLRLTNNPKNPSLTILLKPLDETDRDKAIKLANMIEYTKLVDLVKSIQICFDPNERSTFIETDRLLLEQYYEFEDMVAECAGGDADARQQSKWIIRMEMDTAVLLEKNITMDDIHFAIKNSSYGDNVSCVFSDYNQDKLVFRIRAFDLGKKKRSAGANAETLDQSDEIYLLKNLQDSMLNGVVMRGVNRVVKVSPRKIQNTVTLEDGKFVKKDAWVLDTTGSNLLQVLGLDFIDYVRTYSNDIREVFDVLGIEAARQMLFNEISEVMEFSDAYINYHHLSLLCDRMTMTKNMVPIFRSGILNDDIGPIAKATFEVHTEVLLNAARHADFDHMRGVSASVMCGQYGQYGTGAFNVVLDMKEMAKLAKANVQKKGDIEAMFELGNKGDPACDVKIRNNISSIKRDDGVACDDDYNMGF